MSIIYETSKFRFRCFLLSKILHLVRNNVRDIIIIGDVYETNYYAY